MDIDKKSSIKSKMESHLGFVHKALADMQFEIIQIEDEEARKQVLSKIGCIRNSLAHINFVVKGIK